MEELQQQQPLMRSRPSNSRKVTEPRVAQVRHAANAAHLTHPENAQHGAKNVTSVEIKIILVHVVGPGTEKIPKTETNTDQPIESHKAKGEAGAGIGDMHQRTQRTDLDPPPKVPTA